MDIEKAEATLRDRGAGWVNRRDAALALADAGAKALAALRDAVNDADTDVRAAVARALEDFDTQTAPPGEAKAYPPLREMVLALEKRGKRTVSETDDRFTVEVQLESGRKQTVYLQPVAGREGVKLLRVFTLCGTPTTDAYPWALRANMKLMQGAMALHKFDGEEVFVVMRCFLEGEASPRELKATVKEIAFYGDYIEKKLTGLDDF